ncbi:WbqC family protein [Ichthyenterobacterium magnum]|uniref:WbqC-like protein n=1 Tax=Ichthyenterobacterium magnum TaxID=1230530 RepID=A0A420DGU2_9FLAO|nr:WbqC family protein [Ichthyenterobacterium magnum]RKE92305.1 WbqC-like protein [Ichthyenterobacterium magnum]
MNVLLHPTYCPSIASFVAIANAKVVTYEGCDNYQKQTYRNRTYIYGANGKLLLNIPVVHSQKNRQLYKDIIIANETNWQDLHWKSIQSAYSGSPFFEFYEDDFRPLFKTPFTHLFDFNIKCLEVIYDCLELPFKFKMSEGFEKTKKDQTDYRILVNSKKEQPQNLKKYVQVFDDKHGFIPNLSIIDLIFNEGPNALMYLEAHQLKL